MAYNVNPVQVLLAPEATVDRVTQRLGTKRCDRSVKKHKQQNKTVSRQSQGFWCRFMMVARGRTLHDVAPFCLQEIELELDGHAGVAHLKKFVALISVDLG